MDLSGHEGDLAGMPIPGPYGSSSGTAANFHDNKLRLLSTGSAPASGNGITLPPPHPPPLSVVAAPPAMASSDDHVGGAPTAAGGGGGGGKLKKPVRYRECLKNHAASIGGHALDGCGEFMPSGEEGTMEALKCAACDCHRNFHRREVEGEPLICDICHMNRRERNRRAAAIAAGVTQQQQSSSLAMPLAASSQQQPISSRGPMNLLALSSRPASAGGESDAEQLEASLGQQQQHHHHLAAMTTPLSMKKRFRTKFSIDQKERMYLFAEKVGWRIQKHDEAAVQQFCADVGVKRHVLKVWMHNNKHTFGKRSMVLPPSSSPPPPPPSSSQQHSQQPQQQAIS